VRILTVLFLLTITFQVCFAQEQLRKVDEIGKTNCCDLGARTDNFFNEITATDNKAKGYIVIHSNNQNLKTGLSYERLILGNIRFRGFDEGRIFFVRKYTEGEFKVEFWIDEKGADSAFPNQNEEKFSWFDFQNNLLFLNSKYFNELCSEFGENKQFAEILLANSDLKGHIVIFNHTQKSFLKAKDELLREISVYNIPQNQLRTIFIKIPKDSFHYHELWLVPKKKNS
jgi:hypothetical protein